MINRLRAVRIKMLVRTWERQVNLVEVRVDRLTQEKSPELLEAQYWLEMERLRLRNRVQEINAKQTSYPTKVLACFWGHLFDVKEVEIT